ncbi:glycosyltransferase family 8 protein [Butyrivibrio sp. NC3005]|uniref:glycosyltransferase family 8 protein n=1 Tax=Butyrivibrio sp. NC3005 TaxID=1280685 RepID=UPI000404426B|nr:glycosyltransferase family 8 protein [Butyrivibrio sp. NC3005]
MNIIYATDDNYSFLAGVSIESLFENNKDAGEINVYILDDGISDNNKEQLKLVSNKYGRNLFYVNVKDFIEQISSITTVSYNLENKISFTAYARFFIDKLLPNLEKAIYIDCDTLVVGNLNNLYEYEIPIEYTLGMAVDCTQREYVKSLEIPENSLYYNSGVMLINIDRWKKGNYTDKILKHMKEVRGNYPLVDQDIINVVLNKYIFKIPLCYNVQSPNFMYKTYKSICRAYGLEEKNYYSKEEHKMALSKPVVVHFSGSSFIRPWYCNSNHPMKKIYMDYYQNSVFYDESFYNSNKYNANKSVVIRYLMYKLLPKSINGIVSGFFLKKWIQKTYLSGKTV